MTGKSLSSWFKKVPLGLRILFILSFLAALNSLKDLLLLKPVTLSLFGTDFFINYPALYHLYSIAISVFFLAIVWKKSYQGWKFYLMWQVSVGLIFLLNNFFYIIPERKIEFPWYGWFVGFVYALVALITYYIYRKKDYFNK